MANAGSFKKGEKRPGQGKRGPGKATKLLKEAILHALDQEGGVTYLRFLATEHPSAFATLLGKVLPLQVTGDGGGPVIIATGVLRADDDKS